MAKKTTAEILAAARAKDGGGDSAKPEEKPAPAEKPADAPVAEEAAESNGAADDAGGEEANTGNGSAKESAKPAEKPKSTKDILARLRSEAKGGGQAAASGKSAAPKPAAQGSVAKAPAADKPAAAAATGEKKSPQEMLKALRDAKRKEAEQPGEAAKVPAKPVRGKPAAVRKRAGKPAGQTDRGRRSVVVAALVAPLVYPFATAWVFFSAATAAFSLGLARFMMPNVLVEPPSRFKVGSPGDYSDGTVSTKWKAEYGVWIVHSDYEGRNLIYALISICTHLGCTPNWLEGEQKFKCPCHGSGFYITGVNFEGPAPRPLERAAVRIAPDGMLEVDKSQKFQQELGQWEDAKSFVEVV